MGFKNDHVIELIDASLQPRLCILMIYHLVRSLNISSLTSYDSKTLLLEGLMALVKVDSNNQISTYIIWTFG